METLQLDEGVLLQTDDGIAGVGRVKHVVVDGGGGGADTVHTPDALHQPRGIPRAVVIDNDIRPVQVHAFGQHIGCNHDVVVVTPLFFVLGIEVSLNRFLKSLAVFGAHGQNVLTMQTLFQLFFQIVDGIHAFAEHH